MPTKTFTGDLFTNSSEDWTVPDGATVSYAGFLSPGLDGGVATTDPGIGGTNVAGDFAGGDGTADGTGNAGTAAVLSVNGTPVAGAVSLSEGDQIILAGKGGDGKFAGGGAPEAYILRCPEDLEATFAIVGDNATMTVGDDTAAAVGGDDANGDTPGAGAGALDLPAAFDGWEPDLNSGENGSVGFRQGGSGGLGGEHHHIPGTPTVLAVAGDVIRTVRNGDYTEIKNITSDKIIYHYQAIGGIGDYSDFSENNPESHTEKSGGPGDLEFGGGGAAGQTATGDSTDGGTPDGGGGPGGQHGGDGGSALHHDGFDGATFGDGGGGAAPFFDAVAGRGCRGWASITYATQHGGHRNHGLNLRLGLGL